MIGHRQFEFQSAPPARGATQQAHQLGETQEISIHAPREGGDPRALATMFTHTQFQSTPPARGATLHYLRILLAKHISIHAPREGGDPVHMSFD